MHNAPHLQPSRQLDALVAGGQLEAGHPAQLSLQHMTPVHMRQPHLQASATSANHILLVLCSLLFVSATVHLPSSASSTCAQSTCGSRTCRRQVTLHSDLCQDIMLVDVDRSACSTCAQPMYTKTHLRMAPVVCKAVAAIRCTCCNLHVRLLRLLNCCRRASEAGSSSNNSRTEFLLMVLLLLLKRLLCVLQLQLQLQGLLLLLLLPHYMVPPLQLLQHLLKLRKLRLLLHSRSSGS